MTAGGPARDDRGHWAGFDPSPLTPISLAVALAAPHGGGRAALALLRAAGLISWRGSAWGPLQPRFPRGLHPRRDLQREQALLPSFPWTGKNAISALPAASPPPPGGLLATLTLP